MTVGAITTTTVTTTGQKITRLNRHVNLTPQGPIAPAQAQAEAVDADLKFNEAKAKLPTLCVVVKGLAASLAAAFEETDGSVKFPPEK